MDAKRLSPASSEIRNRYSGALTWFERWDRPVITEIKACLFDCIKSVQSKTGNCDTNLLTCVILLPSRSISYLHLLLYLQRFYEGINLTVMTYQTVVWLCLHSKAVQGLCEPVYVDSVTKQNQQCCHDFQSLTMEHEYFSPDNFSSKITRPKLFKLHVTFCRKIF